MCVRACSVCVCVCVRVRVRVFVHVCRRLARDSVSALASITSIRAPASLGQHTRSLVYAERSCGQHSAKLARVRCAPCCASNVARYRALARRGGI
jgi:hypothetical protein